MPRPIIDCPGCNKRKSHKGHGLCDACLHRVKYHASEELRNKLRDRKKRYYEANRDKALAQKAEYWQRTRAERLAYQHRPEVRQRQYAMLKVRRAINPEQFKAWDCQYRERHLEECRARGRRYYREHQAERYQYILAWNKRNPEKVRQYDRKDRQRHLKARRLKDRLHAHIRRSRIRASDNPLTAEQWQAIIRAYRGRCAYCGRKSSNLTQDHVIPISKGGSTSADNIAPACKSCNSRKRDKAPLCEVPLRLMF